MVQRSAAASSKVSICPHHRRSAPLLCLYEPTTLLERENRETVVDLIRETVNCGIAVVGAFHDAGLRHEVVTRTVQICPLSKWAA